MRRRAMWAWLVTLLLIGVLAAACGGGDDGTGDVAAPSGATAASEATAAPDVEPAPELAEMDGWYNSEPLTLAALRGNPVLIVFWRDT